MNWLTEEQIKKFMAHYNYDIRITHNARWIDQKCTPDVITIIADCILAFAEENSIDCVFSSMDIFWTSLQKLLLTNRFWHLFSFLALASFSGPASINSIFCACLQSLTSFNKFFFNLTFNFSTGIICHFHLLWISFTLALMSKWMVT